MYNRYIGNTGKFVRVEEEHDLYPETPVLPPEYEPPPPAFTWRAPVGGDTVKQELPPPIASEKAKFDLGAVFNMPSSLRGTLKDRLPEAIDLGDILLVLALLYLFLEGEEDEMLIILGVLVFMWIWPLFGKDEDGSPSQLR